MKSCDSRCAATSELLIIQRCPQLASAGSRVAHLRRLSHQHVILWRAAFRLHSHHPHRVAMSLCSPRAVQVHQAHTIFTCGGPNGNNKFYYPNLFYLFDNLQEQQHQHGKLLQVYKWYSEGEKYFSVSNINIQRMSIVFHRLTYKRVMFGLSKSGSNQARMQLMKLNPIIC